MLLFCLYKDQNVVQVHYNNPFRYDGSENVIHHSLEGSGDGDQKGIDLETRMTTNGNSKSPRCFTVVH